MHKWLMAILAVFPIIAAAIVTYNLIIGYLMKRRANKICRDPVSGIMKGAEPVVLTNGTTSKKAALLIHGFIGSPTDYGRLPKLLHKQGYDVYVPLLPGHGTDPKDFSRTTAGDLESFVTKEYRTLRQKYKEVVLVGFSMGGALSILTANKEPVQKLVLLAPYLKIRHQWYYVLPTEVYNKLFMNFVPYTYRPLAFKQINNTAAMPYMVDYDFVALRGADAAIRLGGKAYAAAGSMKQPTLIIHSIHDKATDYRASKRVYEALCRKTPCEFVTLYKTNHIVMWDYDADIAEKAILEFVGPKE